MNKLVLGIIIGLIAGLVIGGLAGYFLHNQINRNFSPRGNFQIDDATKQQIISFFESTSDINEISSYCNQNMMYCFYYCRNINPEHEICSQIQMPANRSMQR